MAKKYLTNLCEIVDKLDLVDTYYNRKKVAEDNTLNNSQISNTNK